MKYFISSLLLFFHGFSMVYGQHIINGTILSADTQKPIAGANLVLKTSELTVQSDAQGNFSIKLLQNDTLIVSFIGYQQIRLPISLSTINKLQIEMDKNIASLQEVIINTGYYQLPKERSTGSFTHVSNEQINRVVTPNILDRLEGITNGLNFDRRSISGENPTDRSPQIRIRGVATIESSTAPLIVVDNFVYESDISTINPNDVESITILKDAAAASIWGARAGNGVIVITTKQGRYNQKTKIAFSSNLTSAEKPDLYYNQNWLPSSTVMTIEEEMFNKGGIYLERNQTPIPAYVELLVKKREGTIGLDEFEQQKLQMEQTDIRSDALQYLYRQGSKHQYALNVSGGGSANQYYLSTGYDKDKEQLIGNDNSRLNLNLQNTFQVLKNIELTAGVWYTRQQQNNNGISLNDLSAGGIGISPYMTLSGINGEASYLVKDYRLEYQKQAISNGLLDWLYRPLDERNLIDDKGKRSEIRLNGGLKYNFLKGFSINANYQFLQNNSSSQVYYAPESYYVRNLVNRFTQSAGEKILPYGAILNGRNPSDRIAHSGRMQLNYQGRINEQFQLAALAGADIRQQKENTMPGYSIYGYDKDLLTGSSSYNYTQRYATQPTGTSLLPLPATGQSRITDRYLSYFGNAAFTVLDRYNFSGSIRWDGSNIFGVKTNQKGIPLWSAGSSWEISKESFYNLKSLSLLRLRATYGSSGTVNNSVSVYPIIGYGTDTNTGLQMAELRTVGNPSLRWEQVYTFNTGIDLAFFGNRLQGSVEYYIKKASDLIGQDFMDPTTGIVEGVTPVVVNKINYADLQTRGLDVQLNSINVNGKFKWESNILFSLVRNKVTNFNTSQVNTIDNYFNFSAPPVIGRSLDQLYALPWNGLDHNTGLPVIYLDGAQSTDYRNWYNAYKIDDLVQAGVTSPPYFGSVRNTFSYRNLQLSANIIWKAGYVFRRNSMYPGAEYYSSVNYHMDYFKRWQEPGDEAFTNVPAAIPQGTTVGNNFIAPAYKYADVLVDKGDHIRLQDISLSYTFSGKMLKRLQLQNVRIFGYARNLGMLWKANKNGIDPEYAGMNYPAQVNTSFGVQVNL